MEKSSVFPLLAFMAVAISILTWYESTQGPPDQPIQLAAANSLTDQEESLVAVSSKDSRVESG